MRFSTGYTLGFAAAVCLVCSVLVSVSAVSLRARQQENARVEVRTSVLRVAEVIAQDASLSPDEVNQRFEASVRARLVDMATGEYAANEEKLIDTFDQRAASNDLARSEPAPPNPAQVQRVPHYGRVYHIMEDGAIDQIVLPVQGKGLWSTLYGFLALDRDGVTIEGITFYEHGETPGLGGEVDNPTWKAQWKGRKAFDEQGDVRIEVVKGQVGPPEQDPYRVDAISGATITSRGVSHLVRFWLGEHGYGPYLERFGAG